MAAVESILERFRESPYRLDVEPAFLQQYFEDRHRTRDIARRVLERDDRFRNLLTNASVHPQLQHGTHLFGQSTVEEHFALNSLVRELKPRQILEIGVFRGQTALTMSRALSQVSPDSGLTGIDIDNVAVEIANELLESFGLGQKATFVVGNSNEIVQSLSGFDLVFIDGDHSYEGVARDFTNAYNLLGTGGVIAMHDVGTQAWGYHQDPGWLFYGVLPELLKNQIQQSWLDSMCRELTMQLLSPDTSSQFHYCDTDEEARELGRLTSIDIINGAGGLGFVVKLDGAHKLSVDDVLSKAPPRVETNHRTTSKPVSLLGRVARKIANHIP